MQFGLFVRFRIHFFTSFLSRVNTTVNKPKKAADYNVHTAATHKKEDEISVLHVFAKALRVVLFFFCTSYYASKLIPFLALFLHIAFSNKICLVFCPFVFFTVVFLFNVFECSSCFSTPKHAVLVSYLLRLAACAKERTLCISLPLARSHGQKRK